MRWFHRPSKATMVATASVRRELERRGFRNLAAWSRGVDAELFRPDRERGAGLAGPGPPLRRPPCGREEPRSVPSDADRRRQQARGRRRPELARLAAGYPEVHFAGARFGLDLARHYASGDVFVFPSRTDTFGLVLLEALASGLPVAAYPVPGPLDVIGDSGCGVLDRDLARAALALRIPRERCRAHALAFIWRRCAEQFLENLHPVAAAAAPRAAAK
jgi:glycosyltransferase involved in cell wall biosynthesis